MDDIAHVNYGENDKLFKTKTNYKDPSMIYNSFVIGLFWRIILLWNRLRPLGMLMARFKDGLFDKVSTANHDFLCWHCQVLR